MARAEIRTVFQRILGADWKHEDQLENLYEMAVESGISAHDLGNKWESFTLNQQLSIVPTNTSLATFKHELREKYKASGVVKKEKDPPVLDKASLPKCADAIALVAQGDRPRFGLDLLDEYMDSNDPKMQLFKDAQKQRQEEAAEEEKKRKGQAAEVSRAQRIKAEELSSSSPVKSSPSASGSQYASRTNRGKITVTFNEALPKALASPTAVAVEELSVVRYKRCMNNNFEAMSNYLEARLKLLGEAALADNDLVAAGYLERPSQEPVISFGRLCSELDEIVTPESFLLEGVAHGLKPRVPLDFSELESYSIFPGQIAAVKGINTGKRLVVSHLLPPKPLPHRAPPLEGVSLLVAAGPYGFGSASNTDMLDDLLNVAKSTRPSAVVLLGPFVDIERAASLTEMSFEDAFFKHIVMRDAHHIFPFPQPPFPITPAKNIHLPSNPAMLSLNGLTIGVSSVDVISALVAREKAKIPASASQQSSDRMSRLSEHLLQQRSFYPLFPAVLEKESGFVDLSLMKDAAMTCSPDILITPFNNAFIKAVSGTLCVNPGFLGKSELGGTYASIVVHPKDGSSGSANSLLERTRAEIVHI